MMTVTAAVRVLSLLLLVNDSLSGSCPNTSSCHFVEARKTQKYLFVIGMRNVQRLASNIIRKGSSTGSNKRSQIGPTVLETGLM